MVSLLFTYMFIYHLFPYLSHINIHIFHYPDSRLSGLFTEVRMSPDNRGLTVTCNCCLVSLVCEATFYRAGGFGLIPRRTNTQGFKIIEKKVLPLLLHLQMVRSSCLLI